MSGGRAFVLDLNADLVNTDMVDVLAVPADQKENLRASIMEFQKETGSEIAAALLADWDASLARFSLIMPRDYARVLASMKRATDEGLPADHYVMEVAANG
jgi:glutamate synthase (NADPH/NADH) large chain